MRSMQHPLGVIRIPDRNDRLDGLYDLSASGPAYWAADTETTGLDIYGMDFHVRLVQVGTADEAWLLRPDWAEHRQAIADFTQRPGTWWHNFVYDALSMEQGLEFPLDATITMTNAQDTEILSRLLDPRGPEHGGVGHMLKSLSAHYLSLPWVKDSRAELLRATKAAKIRTPDGKLLNSNTLWRNVPVDFPDYEYYAGQDVFLAARLAAHLEPMVHARGLDKFRTFETGLAIKCAEMQRIGTAFDAAYAVAALADLREQAAAEEDILDQRFHIEHAAGKDASNAKAGLVKAFEDLGVRFTSFTEKTGAPQLTKETMAELAERNDEAGELARTLRKAKHTKHYGDYLQTMLDLAGKDGRIHPDIRPMRAATARMSISQPPLQQLPTDDDTVRGSLTADEGEVLISADYAQVEFRVAAGISRDPVMIERILRGEDLHAATATVIYGEGFTKPQRDECKRVGFGRLYRGSPKAISSQTGLPLTLVKRACRGFDKAYPATARWGDRVQNRVKAGDTTVVTATGRPLICEKPWAAVNYSVQSPARDIFATGIINLHRQGLGDRLRLVVHDEVILSVPEKEAEDYARRIESAMSTTFKGIPIITEAKVMGKRWKKG